MKNILFIMLVIASSCASSGNIDSASHRQHQLVEARDLSADAALARRGKMPIMLLVSQDHCPFCDQIKREILNPMIVSGEYRDRLLIREIFIDLGTRVRDFKGSEIDSSSFTQQYQVYLTPTLLFLDSDGNELVERMVGIQTPEMFFYYVDRSVQEAIAAFPGKD